MSPLAAEEFTRGLLRPGAVPLHLSQIADAEFAARFAIHRNNVRAARTEALRQGFPVLERLLGAEYFSALADVFVQQHPPRSAAFHEYGAELAGFIEAFVPLAQMGYLADIARLEWARLRAFHAADAPVPEVDALALGGLAQLLEAPLRWHPSVTLLCSAHPVYRLWASQLNQAPTPGAQDWHGENVLIWRQGLQLRTEPLDELGCLLLRHVQRGGSLTGALARADIGVQAGLGRVAGLLLWQVFQQVD